ncbi:hypothetical protein DMH01_06625 [Amycolatopsis sp. WAC 04182]|uniref:restriction endonuclease subunit S n=1 Tax=Amycolatopsis sp. WAC 04182 TaxID=2203198 RepID=UPI000F76EF8E|nr:restriction endonuclease subunit S [Amycolatopsis sp. WAC 04182]RSN66002.1 hypothetical protein DMH01_06625 [Amycolatopsis sp. WAC 04182]
MKWAKKRLKHLCVDAGQYGINVSAQDYTPSGHRLIRTSDINELGQLRSRESAVYIDKHLNVRHTLQVGDLLLSRSGTIGRSMLLGELEESSTYAGYLVRFRPRPGTEPRFLAYVAASSGFQANIESDAVSSTIQNFNAERYANIAVNLPPFEEQHRIADFLDVETSRIDTLTKLRNRQLNGLDAHLQSHLSQVAKDLSKRYGDVRVRHVLQKIEQGWSPQCEDRPAVEGEWGVVKAGCVNGGIFDVTQHKALPVGVEPEIRYRLHPGDLLMSRASGSVDLIGSIGIIPEDFSSRMLLCDKIYRLRMDRTRMTPHFVALMLRTHQAREKIKLGISGADGMANNLPTATVVKLPLPDVPLFQQSHIVDDLSVVQNAVRNSKNTLALQLELLTERRQALITAAVTGQIDVTTARSLSTSEGVAV